jgi:CheY-like chemotaxis protein
MGDPQRLRQCLVNLVGNAIKFTRAGSVTIGSKLVSPAEGPPMMRFEVRDTGIGIAPEDIKRLFEPFVQADSSMTRSFGGTGLGLSIVKRFVEMMDGTVGVSSVLGHGSAFWFDLPLEAAVDEREPASLAPSTPSSEGDAFAARFTGRVLVVEDNNVNQKVARRILERLGCEVDIAENGAEATERCGVKAYDLVLMDMQMPVMDGITATTLIRQRERGKGRTPIVALTANAMNGEHDRCMEAGMDGFLTKPLDIERLCGVLSAFGLRDGKTSNAQVLEAQQHAGTESPSQDPPIDLAKLDEITGGDAEFTADLLQTFFASATESIVEMAQALSGGELQQLARIAHRLKGAAFNIHARAVGEAAAQLEQLAANQPAERSAQAIEAIRVLVGHVEAFLREQRPDVTTRAA